MMTDILYGRPWSHQCSRNNKSRVLREKLIVNHTWTEKRGSFKLSDGSIVFLWTRYCSLNTFT